MALSSTETARVVKEYQRFPGDTGSSEVQIALISETIKQLTPHFEVNKKDHHSRRGLQFMVNRRRKLLEYLRKTNPKGYIELTTRLGLRRASKNVKGTNQ